MNFIRLLPVILSMLILAIHFIYRYFLADYFFYRSENILFIVSTLTCLLILLIRRPWAARLLQAVLVLGGIEWIRTTIMHVKERQVLGAPWERLALILGGVALLTICSTLVFRAKSLRERYGYAHRHQEKSD